MENGQSKATRLLKQGQKGFWKLIFSRTGVITLVLLAQILLMVWALLAFQEFQAHFMGVYILFSIFMVLYLFNTRESPSVKLTWLVVIMVLPIAGSLLYLFTRSELGHRVLKRRLRDLCRSGGHQLRQNPDTADALRTEDPGASALTRYVGRFGNFPVHAGQDVTYFPLGEDKFQALLAALEQAEKYIFLEYYIVDEGEMWGRILEILTRKAAAGVDVRVMYDGTCEFYLLPRDYPEKLARLGIKCKPFSPVTPFLSTHYNYRDHRKILVIDGHTAFTGGVNLADEYINLTSKYGHWKDTAVMVRGDAARSFTLMFLQMWSVNERVPEFGKFLYSPAPCTGSAKGYVMPYGDSPLDGERVGEQVYMDILNRAQEYVHIMTPYLIIDSELENALRYAALRGVEVRLILPGIPDKKLPYALAKTHFARLMEAGVEIYLYDPGFVHAKSFVADGREAVVGTINLDYRSLYHHFECALWMYGVDAIADMERDFQETLTHCSRVTEETLANTTAKEKWRGFILKLIAPLL